MRFVSVIIPVYNDSIGIERAIKSLLSQTYPKDATEILICDNGSTDSTSRVVHEYYEKYPELIKLIYEHDRKGSYAARNKALQLAIGDLIAFTDSDCLPNEHWIENGARALEKAEAECGAGHIRFYYQLEKPNAYEYFDSVRHLNQKAYVEKAGFGATANFFVYKRIFKKYGLFREELISGGDYEFGRRLTGAGEKMIYIPDAVVMHPARSSFKEIYRKLIRVAAGQKELITLGILEPEKISFRSWLPSLRYLRDGYWSQELSIQEKIHLNLLYNLFKYLNLWKRLR
jgi:glycosyltransferase involved in cell wall biosynthesis